MAVRILRGRAFLWVLLAGQLGTLALAMEPMQVHSSSMEPTFDDGDHVVVAKLGRSVQRDDIVAVRHPQGHLLIKRIVGLAGDEVAMEDGFLLVNGTVHGPSQPEFSALDGIYFGPVTVPAHSVFVIGDNLADSEDSRSFGPVSEERVVGRVVFGI